MRSIFTLIFIFFFTQVLLASENYSRNSSLSKNDATLNKSEKTYSAKSILATGKWIRMSSDISGILKLTYARLSELGISNPANVAVYTNGGFMLPKMNNVDYPDDITQIPVIHSKDKSGADCIFFYSPGSTKWTYDNYKNLFVHNINLYSDSTFFFISSDVTASPAPGMSETITNSPDSTFSTYIARNYYEKENISIIGSGRFWYSDLLMDLVKKTYTFSFPNAIITQNAKITATTAARDSIKPSMEVKINNSASFTINYNSTYLSSENSYWADVNSSTWSVPANQNMTVDFTYNTFGTGGDAWLDYISLNVPSKLSFTGSQLDFRSDNALNYNCIKYTIDQTNANCIVLNTYNPLKPSRLNTNYNADSKQISFIDKGGIINEYIIFDPINGTFNSPQFSASVANQNIHGSTSYEMVIVSHPDFINQATTLAEFHRQYDNMNVLVVTTDEVYNEFSSGLPDPAGIRNMFRMFYNLNKNSGTPFKYALLFGDGSYNNRAKEKTSYHNFIPTYESVNSINKGRSYATDDFYAFLDDDEGEDTGDLDIGIGRITCATASEAEDVVTKIVDYVKPKTLGDWRNSICFVADDEESSSFMRNAEDLITLINSNYPGFSPKRIYLDAYKQISTAGGPTYPDVNAAINESVNEGALIVDYIGHGNPISLAHENILTISDIESWKNSTALPLFITATCEFGRFDGEVTSGAEKILLNPSGGGIALFTTTRPVYGTDNQYLCENFYKYIFKHDASGEKLRLGDVMKNAKNDTQANENRLCFSLLADPALRLAFPKYNVHTVSINGINTDSSDTITIGALEKVTIKGEIINSANGNVVSSFSGNVTTLIYDKVDTVETLANDEGTSPFSFPVQNNIIYKGVASVVNGVFELSFIVPKDISYKIGTGKILYYASDNQNDGNGAFSNFNIGGSASNPISDNNPPDIDMFMNNEDFKSYDKVSSSALLLVNLFDESGINTVGTGIGHDIVAVLDSDFSNQIVLNDFYTSVADSYQRGKIIYPISGLEPGIHKIWIRVWDVQNFSSEKEIYFTVEDKFKVTSVSNFPNPVTSITDFEIQHNLPGDVFNVTIDIYNINGQKLHTLAETVSSAKTTTIKVRWNVFQSDYPVYPGQWLVYRVTLKNQNGLTASGAGKLLISIKN
jgi:hypothetical protein